MTAIPSKQNLTSPGAVAVATVPARKPTIVKSRDMVNYAFLLYGPAKAGKSIASVMASAQWDAEKVAAKKPLGELFDTIVIAYDSNPMTALAQFGASVDVISVPDDMRVHGITDVREYERKILFPYLIEAYAAGKRVFSFDAVTTRNDLVLYQLNAEVSAAAEHTGKGPNKLDLWTQNKAENAVYVKSLLGFPGLKLLIGHSAVKDVSAIGKGEAAAMAEYQKNLQRLATDPNGSKIGLAIPGKAGDPYFNDTDQTIAVRFRIDPKTNKIVRFFTCGENPDFRANGRFSSYLDPEEPADLKALMNKIAMKTAESFRESA